MNKLIRCNSQVSTANMAQKKMHVGNVNKEDLYANYYIIENVPHMIKGAVMNEILYGDKVFNELADKLMVSNARIPAPLSHPVDEEGGFMDANDPIIHQAHNIGAFDTDWRVDGDKLISNTYIPVDSVENPMAHGKWLSERIVNKKPIDRSTGLYLEIDTTASGYGSDGEPYNGNVVAINELNHSALLDPDIEPGAKGNAEGIGMFTNTKGDKVEIEDINLINNASTPAMNLPLAPADYQFDMEKAIARIREYTGSKDKPSTNYRKFFLDFDQGNCDSFDSYKGLFADIIDGVPHAIDNAFSDYIDNKYTQAYKTRFEELYDKDGSTALNKAFNVFKRLFVNKDETSYNKTRGEHPCKPTNNEDSDMDRKKMKDMMKNAGMDYSDDMSDEDMMNAMTDRMKGAKTDKVDGTENMGGKPNMDEMGGKDYSVGNAKLVDTIAANTAKAIADAIAPLQAQIQANANQELESFASKVASLEIGIDVDTAKTMSTNALKNVLAANGHANFNASSTVNNSADFSLSNMEAID